MPRCTPRGHFTPTGGSRARTAAQEAIAPPADALAAQPLGPWESQPIAATTEPHTASQPGFAALQPLATASQPSAAAFACEATIVREATLASVGVSATFAADTLARAATTKAAVAEAAVAKTAVAKTAVSKAAVSETIFAEAAFSLCT